MTFIETIPPSEAAEPVAELYATVRGELGHLPNHTLAFSLRPGVYAAWRRLNGTIKEGMDLRRYELATLAAARALRSSYCMLAHGTVLADQFLGPEGTRAVAADHRCAGLDEIDVAVMDLAEQVVTDASAVTEADVGRLRDLGLTDTEIMDVVLAAGARCFFSKVLDGLGVQPDHRFAALDPALRDALVVGRPIEEAAV